MPPGSNKCSSFASSFASAPQFHLSRKTEVMITKKRLIHLSVIVLAFMSVFRLLRLAITTFPYSPVPSLFPPLKTNCNPLDSSCENFSNSGTANSLTNQTISIPPTFTPPIPTLTIKELKFLTDLISQKAPCNLLIFGLEPEYLILSEINSQGTTIMLEDNPDKLWLFQRRSNNTRIHKVDYPIPAKEAFKVLIQARKKANCSPRSGPLEAASKCMLALKTLPEEVYMNKWDVIIVDGPNGSRPDTPGRMAAIYTASVLARAGNHTNVVVHDVDRMIEKWFSWEFLCEDNLVSSKGKFWNFFIEGGNGNQSNSTGFCSPKVD